jgi:adenylate cyclase
MVYHNFCKFPRNFQSGLPSVLLLRKVEKAFPEEGSGTMAYHVHGELVPIGGGDPIPLIRETLIVGRLDSCYIPLRLPNVSKKHCRLCFLNGFWFIEDLGSTNGVKVNGSRVTKKILHPEDTITIAKRTYRVEYDPPVGQSALEELMEDDPLSQPLLEKAGLIRPRRFGRHSPGKGNIDSAKQLPAPEEDEE